MLSAEIDWRGSMGSSNTQYRRAGESPKTRKSAGAMAARWTAAREVACPLALIRVAQAAPQRDVPPVVTYGVRSGKMPNHPGPSSAQPSRRPEPPAGTVHGLDLRAYMDRIMLI